MAHEKFKIEKIEMINKTFKFPADLLEKLEKTATEGSISLNKLVIQCCEYALKNIEN